MSEVMPPESQQGQNQPQPENPALQNFGQPVASAGPQPGMPQPLASQPISASELTGKKSLHTGIISIILSVLLLASLGFGIWAFMERQDYKQNSDQKSAQAVEAALAQQKITLDGEFAEKEKLPNKTYTTPSDSGGVKIVYPKTWGAYVEENGQGGSPINGWFHPGFVPDKTTNDNIFALRVEVLEQPYATILEQYRIYIQQNQIVVQPFRPALVQSELGSRIDGKFEPTNPKIEGAVVLLPLRDKTLKISTQSTAYLADFNNVLANLTYVP